MVSMAVMNQALSENKFPQMKGNYDATQLFIQYVNGEILQQLKEKMTGH